VTTGEAVPGVAVEVAGAGPRTDALADDLRVSGSEHEAVTDNRTKDQLTSATPRVVILGPVEAGLSWRSR
jgi:hypothetical protein